MLPASASPVYHTQLNPRGSHTLKVPFHLIVFLGGVGLLKSKPRSSHTLSKHCTQVLSPSPEKQKLYFDLLVGKGR